MNRRFNNAALYPDVTQIVNTIAELPEATDIATLQADVEARVGIPIRTGPIHGTIHRFRIIMLGRRDGHPHGDLTQEGLRCLVDAARESGDIPLLCRSDR